MLFFLLHMLFRSICHQVSNQADKLALLTIILLLAYLNISSAFLCRFYAIYFVVILHHLLAVFILHFHVFSVACCQPFPIT